MTALIVAIDQGSSSTKVSVIDETGSVAGRSAVPTAEALPAPGWVEQAPEEIWASTEQAVTTALDGLDPARVAGIGLTNQRESLVIWDRASGQPLGPMVSWQDQRTTSLAREIGTPAVSDRVLALSGLPLDPMFSALKARWLLDRYDPDRSRCAAGQVCLGTVDSYLLTRMTGEHVIEIGNASRTQLLDIRTGAWSAELLEIFGVPSSALPRVVASDGDFGRAGKLGSLPAGTPIGAVLGDSHAALFGHGVRAPGQLKATYGTGSSVMTLAGAGPATASGGRGASAGMCRTIAWQRSGAEPELALEGNIRASGATLMWLGRLLGLDAAGVATLAETSESAGVHLVPAFNGLGAPWWDPDATGQISGLTLGTGPGALARAALESVAFQVADVIHAAQQAGAAVDVVLADGGAASNDTLMQLQADLSGLPVERSTMHEASVLGAAHLAGLRAGLWDEDTLAAHAESRTVFTPQSDPAERQSRFEAWHLAVHRSRRNPKES